MRSEPEMRGAVDSIQRLAKRMIIGITPPLVTDFIRKVMPGLGVRRPSFKFENSDRNVPSD